jgi:hypothetical protein
MKIHNLFGKVKIKNGNRLSNGYVFLILVSFINDHPEPVDGRSIQAYSLLLLTHSLYSLNNFGSGSE